MKVTIRGEGPPVIKVAGLVGGVGLYHEEVDSVAAAGYRVATLDTSGDRADDPADGPLSWDRFSDEVAEAVDRLGEPAVLWGTSFGTLVALAAAARHPARVAGLLLAFPVRPGWRPRPYEALFRSASRADRPERTTTQLFHAGFYLLSAWEFVYPQALRRLPGLARAAYDASTPDETIFQKLSLLFDDEPRQPDEDMPLSIIAGQWDTITPVGQARRLAETLHGRLRVMSRAGHAGAFSRPETYVRIVKEELGRLTVESRSRRAAGTSR